MESDKIEELKKNVEVQRSLLALAEKALREARVKASGFSIDQIVKDRNGKEFRIVEIDAKYESVWLKGNPRKKDGTFGKSIQYIYR